MKKIIFALGFTAIMVVGCVNESSAPVPGGCIENAEITALNQRNFKLGFSTWSFGPDPEDKNQTYQFIQSRADICSEQIEHKIPWNAWINDTPLPTEAGTKKYLRDVILCFPLYLCSDYLL